jgi:hypothetical protein
MRFCASTAVKKSTFFAIYVAERKSSCLSKSGSNPLQNQGKFLLSESDLHFQKLLTTLTHNLQARQFIHRVKDWLQVRLHTSPINVIPVVARTASHTFYSPRQIGNHPTLLRPENVEQCPGRCSLTSHLSRQFVVCSVNCKYCYCTNRGVIMAGQGDGPSKFWLVLVSQIPQSLGSPQHLNCRENSLESVNKQKRQNEYHSNTRS